MLYVVAGLIGFVLAKIFAPPAVSPFFNDVVMKNIRLGKRVVICVDTEATIFEMIKDRVRITRGTSDFFLEDDNVASVDNLSTPEPVVIDKDLP